MKLLFNYLTNSFFILENPIYNYVIMGIIGVIAFKVAYSVVGDLYRIGIIEGCESGHVLHWLIRLVVFVIIFYIFATVVRIYKWFTSLPNYKWWVVGSIIVLLILVGCLVKCYLNKVD